MSAFLLILLVAGLLAGLGLRMTNPRLGFLLALGSGVLFALSLANFVVGTTVQKLQGRMQDHCLAWLIKRQVAATGFEFTGIA
jgi:hypothetical protein